MSEKLYIYRRSYAYGDCEEMYIVKADDREHALLLVEQEMVRAKRDISTIKEKYLSLVDFKDSSVAIIE